jgi:hypothetical protein
VHPVVAAQAGQEAVDYFARSHTKAAEKVLSTTDS